MPLLSLNLPPSASVMYKFFVDIASFTFSLNSDQTDDNEIKEFLVYDTLNQTSKNRYFEEMNYHLKNAI